MALIWSKPVGPSFVWFHIRSQIMYLKNNIAGRLWEENWARFKTLRLHEKGGAAETADRNLVLFLRAYFCALQGKHLLALRAQFPCCLLFTFCILYNHPVLSIYIQVIKVHVVKALYLIINKSFISYLASQVFCIFRANRDMVGLIIAHLLAPTGARIVTVVFYSIYAAAATFWYFGAFLPIYLVFLFEKRTSESSNILHKRIFHNLEIYPGQSTFNI